MIPFSTLITLYHFTILYLSAFTINIKQNLTTWFSWVSLTTLLRKLYHTPASRSNCSVTMFCMHIVCVGDFLHKEKLHKLMQIYHNHSIHVVTCTKQSCSLCLCTRWQIIVDIQCVTCASTTIT